MALTAVVLEQDAAYWEVHVEQQQPSSEAAQDSPKSDAKKCNAMFGVATKKDRQFYNKLEESEGDEGTHLLLTSRVLVLDCLLFIAIGNSF